MRKRETGRDHIFAQRSAKELAGAEAFVARRRLWHEHKSEW